MSLQRAKRNSNIQVALAEEDVKILDSLSHSTPFRPSRSEMGCVFVRFAMSTILRGHESLEALFHKHLLRPLSIDEKCPFEDEIKEIMRVNGFDREEAISAIFARGIEDMRITGWQSERAQVEGRKRA
jgi:hypothetical protein